MRPLRAQVKLGLDWIRSRVPPGLRTILGLLLIVGGIFGFLPILGFWMIPLGILVIALDVRALVVWLGARRGAKAASPAGTGSDTRKEDDERRS